MTETLTSSANFSEFGDDFQEKVMQALIIDHTWAEQMVEIIRPEYFELSHLQFIANKYFEYYNAYKTFPTDKTLLVAINEGLKEAGDDKIVKRIKRFFVRMKKSPELNDIPYVQNLSKKFCKNQEMAEALDKSVDLMQQGKYDDIIPILRNALTAGDEASLGHDFFEDREARWIKEFRRPIPTGIPELDCKEVFSGGVGRGELAVFAASKGVGKSHWLVNIGASALELGYNVLHYTFELKPEQVGLRYDSWICDINSKEIADRKDDALAKYDALQNDPSKSLGRLIIKKYPIRSVSVNTLRAHIRRLMLKKDFKPDIIIVDYADNMRGSESYDVSQTRHELKRIYEELRNLADEYEVPVWTASQLNKEGSKDDIATIEHMAESFGKADDADIIITMSMNLKKKATGYGKIYIAKSRAGEDGQTFCMHVDRSRSRFRVVSDEEMPDTEDDEKASRDRARKAARRIEKRKLDDLGSPVTTKKKMVH